MSYNNPPGGQGGSPYGMAPPGGPAPSSYLVWSILTTLFCCLPFGIVSIVFAAQVNSKWNAGDFDGARSSSQNAKKWAIASAIAGVIVIILIVILRLAAGSSSSAAGP